jgi:hypothetical protein
MRLLMEITVFYNVTPYNGVLLYKLQEKSAVSIFRREE